MLKWIFDAYHQTSSIRCTKSQNKMFLVLSCICLCPIHWSQVLSREWRCSWSSADRQWSKYIWVINNFIAYWGAFYIRGLKAYLWGLKNLGHHYFGVMACHVFSGKSYLQPMLTNSDWSDYINKIMTRKMKMSAKWRPFCSGFFILEYFLSPFNCASIMIKLLQYISTWNKMPTFKTADLSKLILEAVGA